MSAKTKPRERKYFTKFEQVLKLPDLIEVQKDSYNWFFKAGLKELFEEINPIKDFIGRDLELYFLDFYFEFPTYALRFKLLPIPLTCSCRSPGSRSR